MASNVKPNEYELWSEQYCHMQEAWVDVETQLNLGTECPSDLLSLRLAEKTLAKIVGKYREQSLKFLSFLSEVNTTDSRKEMETHSAINRVRESMIETVISQFDRRIELAVETASQHSHRSRSSKSVRSHGSSVSSLLAKSRVKAQGARKSYEYARKELDIKRQHAQIDEQQTLSVAQAVRKKVELDADLQLLQQEKEAAIAEAEMRALQEVSDLQDVSVRSDIVLPTENITERTKRYVQQHVRFDVPNAETSVKGSEPDPETQNKMSMRPMRPQAHTTSDSQYEGHPAATHVKYAPATVSSSFTDLTQFLLKKELLLSRLITYDDRPETYAIWKAGFRSIMNELKVNDIEEFDLLVKWLGTESSKHAISLRAANVRDPAVGLARLWARLDERYGCPETVEASLKNKLATFPKLTNKDNKKLYELSDIVAEVEAAKDDDNYKALLSYFDTSSGVNPIVNKLPYSLQEKWTTRAAGYKQWHSVPFPPFSMFAAFLREMSKTRNDPSFVYDTLSKPTQEKHHTTKLKTAVSVRKTDIVKPSKPKEQDIDVQTHCPLHGTKHTLNQCKGFRARPIQERKDLIRKLNMCYKCCASNQHIARSCQETRQCTECGSSRHATALHTEQITEPSSYIPREQLDSQTGKVDTQPSKPDSVASKCTQICGEGFCGKSCAKTILVNVYPKGEPNKAQRMYALLDDQSNRSLARSEFFKLLDVHSASFPYTLASCAGSVEKHGRRASGYVVESLNGSTALELPTLIECDEIPDLRDEIPTPEVAQNHSHLRDITSQIPALDNQAAILLLIGRDLMEAHHVLDQRIGPRNSPYAQRLRLGWVIIGEACLGKVHKPDRVKVYKTYLLPNGRSSLFKPCQNNFEVKTILEGTKLPDTFEVSPVPAEMITNFGSTVFERTKDDDKPSFSTEDKAFLRIMDREFHRDSSGNWVAPLPFRNPRPQLPNNRSQAMKRAKILDRSLQKNVEKREHFMSFMQRIFDRGHAELAPPLEVNEECWYLPIFGVYHPKKPDQIRAVFDSSAQQNGISLNSVLLRGPDLTNSLLGVLLRFRKEAIAIMADIQQMFHCFYVREDHRNFLRFLWYRDNNMDKDLVEYRMCVHVFGNSPSPAVATYGLRRAAQEGGVESNHDVKEFVQRNFYVDDGLASFPTQSEAIDLMKRTQEVLSSGGNLRLHKISSNSTEVMEAFPAEDRAKDFKDLILGTDALPTQRSLGLTWNLTSDMFTFQVNTGEKPYTRRGILSTASSLFDPLGFVAPVIIQGRIFLREMIAETIDWDEPLPVEHQEQWEEWKNSLVHLERLHVPRTYTAMSVQKAVKKEIHVFSDASQKAIAAVAYLQTTNIHENSRIGFILGKAKVAPSHGHIIPRLELCAAVLAVEIAEFIVEQLDISPDAVYFYTDSKIVLGYIHNQSRRFFVYVGNRVERIRKSTSPEQWRHVPTALNPADQGTRSVQASEMEGSCWLVGPRFLLEQDPLTETFPLADPDDKELRPLVHSLGTNISELGLLGTHRFERFSSWRRLVETYARLKHIAQSFHTESLCKGWHICPVSRSVKSYTDAEQHVIKIVQHEYYSEELKYIKEGRPLPKDSQIITLDPIINDAGVLVLGGRISRSEVGIEYRNPVIVPGRHHIATLLVRHYHESVKHQGRHFTEGAIRATGLWIIGGRRLITSVIHKCVTCRKLRGKQEHQKMSDLPPERLVPGPPFTHVGVDAFGPWTVVTRRTRGGQANTKRWAILFTCLTSRAIHIEVIEDMSSSAFINALRRFTAIRGKVTQFRSDRGTNFIGSTDDLQIDVVNVEDGPVKNYLYNRGTEWIFNPPHSSHMGGVWERMIGVTRRILDTMLADVAARNLTHEVLTTFMAEVCAIVNARPIVPVSSDPESPLLLSPSTLLTQKLDHVTAPLEEFDMKDLYKAQWRRVQALADIFWKRWKAEYLHTLQPRRKWQHDRPNINTGDIILLKDSTAHRNEWPMGVIMNAIPGVDNKVRKAVVRIMKDGKFVTYTRPITEMIVLL